MEHKRYIYRRKRSTYRKLKIKFKSQLAKERENDTHPAKYHFIMGFLIITSYLIVQYTNSLLTFIFTIIFLGISFIYLENLVYSLHKIENNKGEVLKEKIALSFLAIKEIIISGIFLVVIFSIIIMILIIFKIPLNNRYIYIFIFSSIFFLSLLFYHLYSKFKLDRFFFQKTAKKEKAKMERLKKEDYRDFFLNITDLFAILVTIVLLINSTAILIYPIEITDINSFLGTFEFYLLLCALANYVPAVYHRMPH